MGAIIFNYLCYIIKLLWIFKIEIITGVFAGLTIYAYFYRVLTSREKSLTKTIKKIDNIIKIVEIVTDKKSEIKTILDAVAGFNDSINGFREKLENSMGVQLDKLEVRLKDYFIQEINRTNEDVKELKIGVDVIKNKVEAEKLLTRKTKYKVTVIASIGFIILPIITGAIVTVIQYYINSH